MGTLYVDSGGAGTNGGSTDQNSANHSGSAATVAGSVVTLDTTDDISGLATSGANQAAIYINQATNTNKLIFWITAVDNGAKTVTVDTAPTGVTSSAWAIGGRQTSLVNSVDVLRAGDTCILNTNVSGSTSQATFRADGNSTAGYVRLIGKSGARRSVTCTGTSAAITGSTVRDGLWLENLEVIQQGASGNAISNFAGFNVMYNVKISDAGGDGVGGLNTRTLIAFCEISGVGSHGINDNGAMILVGNYIHDVGGSGVDVATGTGAACIALHNVIERCTGVGVKQFAASTSLSNRSLFFANTVYRCDDSGIEVGDADIAATFINNVLMDNGNAGTEANIEYSAGSLNLVGISLNNCTSIAGARGGVNLLNATLDAASITTNPAFVDPDNGSATSRNFGITSSSPCKATGWPSTFLGSGSVSSVDMGAVQRQDAGGAGGVVRHPGMNAGFEA